MFGGPDSPCDSNGVEFVCIKSGPCISHLDAIHDLTKRVGDHIRRHAAPIARSGMIVRVHWRTPMEVTHEDGGWIGYARLSVS